MADSTFANIDNQFVAIRPILPTRPVSEVRPDYRQTLLGLKSSQNVDSSQPNDNVQTTQQITIKKHESHSPLISRGFFQSVLEASFIPEPLPEKKRRFNFDKMQIVMSSLAVIILLGGAYLSYMGWQYTNVSRKQAASLTKIANQTYASGLGVSPKNALSTTPISSSALADYTVSPNLPRYLIIPKLNVDARVLSVGVNSSGAIGAPDNIFDTAWYNESAEPGQPGAVLIDGHVSSWTAHGVFYGLTRLVPGDTIQIKRGDGTMFTYSVVKT